jgi:dihydroorotate dehydrogenase
MGFNNKGVDYLAQKIQAMPRCCILGINIGKNKSTPLETAVNDYRYGLERAYPLADYITLNISSPNTPGLRALQQKNYLFTLLESLKQQQALLANAYQRYVPLVVKIDPDLSEAALVELADILISCQIDGVIATNTTVAREHLAVEAHSEQAGGLSGRPLFQRSTHVIAQLQQHLKGALPIIGVGGIDSGAAAIKKLAAGASLLQIYSSLIYQGPSVIQDIRRAIVAKH